MKFLHLIAFAGISVVLTNSCKHECEQDKEGPCPTSVVAFTQLPGWDLNPSCSTERRAEIGVSKTYVINSLAEYKTIFDCSVSPPAIDFNTYTLLAGKTVTSSCSYVTSQQVMQTCTGYKYTVNIGSGLCAAVTEVKFHALVPKISITSKVEFEIKPQ